MTSTPLCHAPVRISCSPAIVKDLPSSSLSPPSLIATRRVDVLLERKRDLIAVMSWREATRKSVEEFDLFVPAGVDAVALSKGAEEVQALRQEIE